MTNDYEKLFKVQREQLRLLNTSQESLDTMEQNSIALGKSVAAQIAADPGMQERMAITVIYDHIVNTAIMEHCKDMQQAFEAMRARCDVLSERITQLVDRN